MKRKPIKHRGKMPGPMRVGIALLILGAIIVGLGTVMEREYLSTYGFIVVICGFFLYFVSSIYLKRIRNPGKY